MKTRRKPDDSNGAAPAGAAPGGRITQPLVMPTRPPATSSRLAWPAVALRTDVGRVRTDNQDHVLALTMLLPGEDGGGVPFGFYAVADGMGGLADGARASHTAA